MPARNTLAGAHGAFPPTIAAVSRRLAEVRPGDYARTRNSLSGAVTHLSPYLAHGFLTLPDAYAEVRATHRIEPQHKLFYEFGWREFFHHVWERRGDAIFSSLHAGLLPDDAYTDALPADILEGRTGVPVIDEAVRRLYATGYLHNHARMWLASYVVHLRKVHWRTGADWLYAHLLDGDLASNHLSWQWIAATFSGKPYLFNADNVAKYAPDAWRSAGTVIDTTYETLDAMARARQPLAASATADGVDAPELLAMPPSALGYSAPDRDSADGRDVWLVHPWALREPPPDLPVDTVIIALVLKRWHALWPWSHARWHFVGTRQRELAAHSWLGDTDAVRLALAGARSVATVADPHYGHQLGALFDGITLLPVPRLFEPVSRDCESFSQWWRAARLDARWG
jgi:deoxyribodipyrimidine photo-lyase